MISVSFGSSEPSSISASAVSRKNSLYRLAAVKRLLALTPTASPVVNDRNATPMLPVWFAIAALIASATEGRARGVGASVGVGTSVGAARVRGSAVATGVGGADVAIGSVGGLVGEL